MQQGESCEVVAIASRELAKARAAAELLGISSAYGSYEELLSDPNVDAVFVPLPNDLHVAWSIKAARAGKHVLCEKPIGLGAEEVRALIAAREETGVKIGEAFMVRTHPQWLRVRKSIQSGQIGKLRAVSMLFSYFNQDPADIRNLRNRGGGALLDIGCYAITLSRFAFGEEPVRAIGLTNLDPEFQTDRLTSAILEFPSGQSVFLCSTQLARYQRFHLLGTKGRIDVEVPVNARVDAPTRISINDSVEEIAACNQYAIQGELFSRAILENGPVPVPLEDGLKNTMVIDAILRSVKSGHWETPIVES
jgi:predicted dehydrogenase